jgi:uncharacterized protein YyaL (SSP411 family)
MTQNLLRYEASPYLLQHKDNPVHWRPWGPAALEEARRSNKPILLSVGYAACHWCHVMAHESFEDKATAEVMNRLFVNIKVDREERPDVDQIYMAALHALGEPGGWPLTMFLTPSGEPIWGGTYFPREARYGRPAFVSILQEVARFYNEEPDKVEHNRALLMDHLARTPPGSATTLDESLLDRAAARLLSLIDPDRGGIRGAPKFPQASLFEFLWRAGVRTSDRRYTEAVLLTLRNIANGGIYDHLGGGFARYSVDERWLVPHFEKMLYDNGQLIELMTYAWLDSRDQLFRARIEETVTWLEREMLTTGGAFAASLDADSEGHEGRFYVWTRQQIADILGAEEGAFFAGIYDVTGEGNWEGVSILNRLDHPGLLTEAEESRLKRDRERLLAARASRTRPATDDKILTDWNGIAIAALAFAGATLNRADWIARAEAAFRFITNSIAQGGRLAHSHRQGKSVFPAVATDYACAIKAALSLQAATLEPRYLHTAKSLAEEAQRHYWDSDSFGYFLSADDAEALILRPKSVTDEATPSATGLMAANLVRLWRLTGDARYRRDVDEIMAAASPAIANNLFAATSLLSALDLRLNAVDAVIVGPTGSDPAGMVAAVRRSWTPSTVFSVHSGSASLPAEHPAAGKRPVDGRVTAYVCRGDACSLPVTEPDDLPRLLAAP